MMTSNSLPPQSCRRPHAGSVPLLVPGTPMEPTDSWVCSLQKWSIGALRCSSNSTFQWKIIHQKHLGQVPLHRLQLGLQLLSFYQGLLFHVPSKGNNKMLVSSILTYHWLSNIGGYWRYLKGSLANSCGTFGDHRGIDPSKLCESLKVACELGSRSHYGSSGWFLLYSLHDFDDIICMKPMVLNHPHRKQGIFALWLVNRLIVTNYELLPSFSI